MGAKDPLNKTLASRINGVGELMNTSLLSLRNSRLSSLPKVKIFHWSCSLYIFNDSVGEESACSAGDTGDVGSVHGLGRSPGGGNSNPLQYSCLKNPMDRGARWAAVHGVAKSRTRLSDFTFTFTLLNQGFFHLPFKYFLKLDLPLHFLLS